MPAASALGVGARCSSAGTFAAAAFPRAGDAALAAGFGAAEPRGGVLRDLPPVAAKKAAASIATTSSSSSFALPPAAAAGLGAAAAAAGGAFLAEPEPPAEPFAALAPGAAAAAFLGAPAPPKKARISAIPRPTT